MNMMIVRTRELSKKTINRSNILNMGVADITIYVLYGAVAKNGYQEKVRGLGGDIGISPRITLSIGNCDDNSNSNINMTGNNRAHRYGE